MAVGQSEVNGRFLPGNKLGGMPKSKKALLDALGTDYDAPTLMGMIREAWKTATGEYDLRHRSAKSQLAIIEFIAAYLLGKPKQSVELGTDDMREFLLAVVSDKRPVLPARTGVIESPSPAQIANDTAQYHNLFDERPMLGVDTTIDGATENAEETQDD